MFFNDKPHYNIVTFVLVILSLKFFTKLQFPTEVQSQAVTFYYSALHCTGEIYELRGELNSDKKERKKEALKKVIASMTVGKDVRYFMELFSFEIGALC